MKVKREFLMSNLRNEFKTNKDAFAEYLENLDMTEEQFKQIDDQIYLTAARNNFVGRSVYPVEISNVGIGAQTIKYYTETEISDAVIEDGFILGTDNIDLTENNKKVPIIQKAYMIPARDLASSKLTGTPLDATVVDSATYKTQLKEEDMLLLGRSKDGTNYEIDGLWNIAGNTVTGSSWATTTNIPGDIVDAIGEMETDNIFGPYALIVNSAQHKYMLTLIANTGISYQSWVESTLGVGGKIYVSNRVTAGTAIMVPAYAHNYFKYKVMLDLTHREWMNEGTLDVSGIIYICGRPIFTNTNAICAISSLT